MGRPWPLILRDLLGLYEQIPNEAKPLNCQPVTQLGNVKPIPIGTAPTFGDAARIRMGIPGLFPGEAVGPASPPVAIMSPSGNDYGVRTASFQIFEPPGLVPVVAGPGTSQYRLVAQIVGGTGNGKWTAFVDVRRGTQLTVVTSSASISIGFAGLLPTQIDPNTQVSCGVCLAEGATAEAQASLTGEAREVAAGGAPTGDVVGLPPFATHLVLFTPDGYPATLSVDLLTSAVPAQAAVLGTLTNTALEASLTATKGAALPNGCRAIRINNGAQQAITATPMFTLGL